MIAEHTEIVTFAWLKGHGLRVLIFLFLATVVSFAGVLVARRIRRRIEGPSDMTIEQTLQRTVTITNVISSTIRVVVWGVTFLLVLGELGVNLAPLLAGAGIAGVALGFGAQSLVGDFLAGFFILFENQLAVGNVVDVRAAGTVVSGTAEALTLRTTAIRSFDGTLHTIPNGNIELIGNRSRGWARAIIDVRIARGSDVEKVRQLLETLFDEMESEEAIKGAYSSRPTLLGVETVGSLDVVFRVVAETRPSRRPEVERELRARIERRLERQGIKAPIAYPPGNAASG